MNSKKVAIIGAGPAGLATARALKTLGIPFVVYEKHSNVGGIWDTTNPGSPMYNSAHFISSRDMSGHLAYPMPSDYPDYPSNGQILAYIKGLAQHYGLLESIRFNTEITDISFSDDVWAVKGKDHDGKSFNDVSSWLVCASGTNWHKSQPTLKGQEKFDGELMHSVDYRDSASLSGERVLVVGAGNSGVDIACDAAFSAKEAYISMRRGYHFVPKHLFGMPADVFGSQSDWMPTKMQQLIFSGMLRMLNGDLRRLGLQKPDHKVLSSHPILNTQLLHYLQHGDIKAMPDIQRLAGNTVHFVDGRSVEVDKIIMATGYQWKVPYLPDQFFEWKGGRPQTFMKIFNSDHPSLFVNGFVETNGGAYKLFDDMAYLIAKTIETQIKDSKKAALIQRYIEGQEPDLGGQVNYVKSDRHIGYTNSNAYQKALKAMRRTFDWPDLDESFYRMATSNKSAQTDQPAVAAS